MTKRPIAMLSVLALSLVAIEGWQAGNSISVQALEGSSASTSHEQTTSPDPRAVTWEYKILTGDPTYVGRAPSNPVRGAVYPINVEEEINRLAVQGYVVESFQANSSTYGTIDSNASFNGLRSALVVVVLLKRMRK